MPTKPPVVDEAQRDEALKAIRLRPFSLPAAKGAKAALAQDHRGTVISLSDRRRA